MRFSLALSILAALLLGASGCGYTFQTSNSPLAEREGIRKIYVAPMTNNTYTPGVENVVYNALVQTLSVHRRVTLVSNAHDADAILKGVVSEADYITTAPVPAQQLQPPDIAQNPNFLNILVAQYYSATLGCGFVLERVDPSPLQKKIVWSAAFTRSKPFAASNQVGVPGTTSALINQSEFDRALSDIANSMTGDIHESMLAMF
jgi:Lipopolysaccharide-assembly